MDKVKLSEELTIQEMVEGSGLSRKDRIESLKKETEADFNKLGLLIDNIQEPLDKSKLLEIIMCDIKEKVVSNPVANKNTTPVREIMEKISKRAIAIHYKIPSMKESQKILLGENSEFRRFLGEESPIYLEHIDDMVSNFAKLMYTDSDARPNLPPIKVIEALSNERTKNAVLADIPSIKHIVNFIFSKSFAGVIDDTKSSLVDAFIDKIQSLEDQDIATSCWNQFTRSMKKYSNSPEYRDNMKLVVVPRSMGCNTIRKITFLTSNKSSFIEARRLGDKFLPRVFARFVVGYFNMDAASYFSLGYDYDRDSPDCEIPKLLFDHAVLSKSNDIIKHANNRAGILQINDWIDRIIQNPIKKNDIWLYGSSQFDNAALVTYAVGELQKMVPWLGIERVTMSELKLRFDKAITSTRNESDSTKKREQLNIFNNVIADCSVLIIEGFDDIVNQYGIIKRLQKNLPDTHILIVSNNSPERILNELRDSVDSLPEKASYSPVEGQRDPTIFREQYFEFISALDQGFDKTFVGIAPDNVRRKILDKVTTKELGFFDLPDEVKNLIVGFVQSISYYEIVVNKLSREKDRWDNGESINEDAIIKILKEIITLEIELEITLVRRWFDDFLYKLSKSDNFNPSGDEKDKHFVYFAYHMTRPSFYHFQQKTRTRLAISNSIGRKSANVVREVIKSPKGIRKNPYSHYYQQWQDYFYKRVIQHVKPKSMFIQHEIPFKHDETN